jgi:UDP-N-acetylglucosamine--N-acetylmuramyl-(pentapeptide) pyrophosphoryl-undecaprenol N-acetylglucosamine transferase
VRSLRELAPAVDLRWVGGYRGLEARLVTGEGIALRRLWLRTLRSTDLSLHVPLDALRLGASFPQAALLMARWRPDAIYSTGGYVALPVLAAASAMGVPSLLWEGNVVPGRSTRLASRWASAVSVSFGATCAALGGPCRVTGTPTRPLGGLDRGAARARLAIDPGGLCLLIFGGSQAVRRFDQAVSEVLAGLVERATVIHLTGQEGEAEAQRRRDALPADLRDRYRPYAFLGAEMADALAAADVVVGRAGSSTLAEVTALGRAMVVVPYPHAAGHQRANALAMAEAGAAELIADEAFDGAALLAACQRLADPGLRERMEAASRRLGRPGSARANAELLLALARRSPLPDAAAVESIAREAA